MPNIERLKKYKKVHMVGIGGVSMSGIAEILVNFGFQVTGSNNVETETTKKLEKAGIKVFIGHNEKNIVDQDVVVYSAAIKQDNPELVTAKSKNIPIIERADFLGELTRCYKDTITISGTHGKSTTTSMVSLCFLEALKDPSIQVGADIKQLNGNYKVGNSEYFIIEACEYVESFLTLHPTVVLINNIDNDHLDYFKTMDNIVNAFRKFVARMPVDGLFVGCTDDSHVRQLLDEFGGRKTTYGLDLTNSPDYYPADVHYDGLGCASFDLMHRGERLGRVTLHVPGQHNMLDAIAASAVALEHGTDIQTVITALARFRSVQRRFEYYGERNGVRVFHDYAHHPAEIRAAMDCALRTPHKKLFVVFQCNSFTRARTLFTENVDCFRGADKVLVPDIYPGREKDDGSVHARDMVASINAKTSNAEYMPTFEQINDYLLHNAAAGDIVLTLGSGDVYKQTKLFLE